MTLPLPTILRLRALCAEILAHAQAIERLKGEVESEVERARKRFGFTPFGVDDRTQEVHK